MAKAIGPAVTHTGTVGGDDAVFEYGYFDNLSNGAMEVAIGDVANMRRRLTADTVFYVRKEGSDENDGLSATNAFATITRAQDELLRVDGGGYQVTLNIGAGTWDIPATRAYTAAHTVGMTRLTIAGAGMASTIFNKAAGQYGISVSGTSVPVYVSGVKFQNGSIHVYGTAYTDITVGNVDFGTTTSAHLSTYGGTITVNGNYKISGNAPTGHIYMSNNAFLLCQSRTITIENTPSFSFMSAVRGSYARVNGNTFAGSSIGRRYIIGAQSSIETGGAGEEYFPGTVAGTAESARGAYYF